MEGKSVKGKVALITGANKGIGLAIARQLGRQGMTVLLGARDEGRGRAATEKCGPTAWTLAPSSST